MGAEPYQAPRGGSPTLITGPAAGGRRRPHRSLRMRSAIIQAISLAAPEQKRMLKGAKDLKCGGVMVRALRRRHSSLRSHRDRRLLAKLSGRAVAALQLHAASSRLKPMRHWSCFGPSILASTLCPSAGTAWCPPPFSGEDLSFVSARTLGSFAQAPSPSPARST